MESINTESDNNSSLLNHNSPVVVLCRPQLGENIGTAARAMLNCGVINLRLVSPRDGWPNPKALSACSGADSIIAETKIFSSLVDAVSDCQVVFASSARPRDVMKRVVTPRQAAREIRAATNNNLRIALLFGPERTGLNNDEIGIADSIIEIPLNPSFSSLNLAQAVLILCYEWYLDRDSTSSERFSGRVGRPVDKKQLYSFFEFLDISLEEHGFYPTPEMRPSMVRNIRAMFTRIELTQQDLQTLYGIIKNLLRPKIK
ncbi:MAG: rRNA methyltransferase [Rhodospirillaceae bacterium]|nr:rRNA methyltransferase [Rhodospirillaceae bacterium]|tara:strand:- start:159 stop:935 length:777 start_codon:yes stop_codon:yes gene_type:complete